MADDRNDPLPVFCFKVELSLKDQGKPDDAYFKSVGGLRYETEVVPVRAGGVNDTTFNLPGATKWSNLVLKQGFTKSSKLIQWRQDWIKGPGQGVMHRADGRIILLDTAMQEKAIWSFTRAWPCKWEISELDASKSELAIETLELAIDGLRYG